jgi:hypothetical protein
VPSTTRREDAAQNHQQKQPANAGSEANDQGLVVVDPGLDFAAY